MAEQTCPVCGCVIVGRDYGKRGIRYCCASCVIGSGPCEYGCCQPAEEKKGKR